MPLAEADRSRLDGIVSQMQANGEQDENIQHVVNDFSQRYDANSPSVAGSFGRSAARGFLPATLGGRFGAMAGAAAGGALEGGLLGSEVPVVGNIVGGLVGAGLAMYGASKLQTGIADTVAPDVSNPFSTASEEQDVTTNPNASLLGGLASAGRPSFSTLGNAVKSVATKEGRQLIGEGYQLARAGQAGGAAAKAFEDVTNVAGNVGIGGVQGAIQGESLPEILKGAAGGAVFNQGWLHGAKTPHGEAAENLTKVAQNDQELLAKTKAASDIINQGAQNPLTSKAADAAAEVLVSEAPKAAAEQQQDVAKAVEPLAEPLKEETPPETPTPEKDPLEVGKSYSWGFGKDNEPFIYRGKSDTGQLVFDRPTLGTEARFQDWQGKDFSPMLTASEVIRSASKKISQPTPEQQSPTAEVLPPEAKAEQPQAEEPIGHVSDLSGAELRQMADRKGMSDHEVYEEVLGKEGAKQYARLLRLENSQDSKKATDAGNERSKIEDSLTEPQRKRLYGIGETDLPNETIKGLADIVERTENAADVDELASILKYRVSDLKKNPESPSEVEATAAFKAAARTLKKNGWDGVELQDKLVTEFAKRFSDPADAYDLLEGAMGGVFKRPAPQKKVNQPSPNQAALEAPSTERVVSAAYTDDNGVVHEGTNHIEAADKAGVKAPNKRKLRETPEYGFMVESADGTRRVVSRREAWKIAEASKQLTGKTVRGGRLHSDQVEMPEQPKAVTSKAGLDSEIDTAYRELALEQGTGDVRISDLQERSKVPMEELKEWVRDKSRKGEVSPTRSDWSLAGEAERSGAIDIGGEPHMRVRLLKGFKTSQDAPEAKSAPSTQPEPQDAPEAVSGARKAIQEEHDAVLGELNAAKDAKEAGFGDEDTDAEIASLTTRLEALQKKLGTTEAKAESPFTEFVRQKNEERLAELPNAKAKWTPEVYDAVERYSKSGDSEELGQLSPTQRGNVEKMFGEFHGAESSQIKSASTRPPEQRTAKEQGLPKFMSDKGSVHHRQIERAVAEGRPVHAEEAKRYGVDLPASYKVDKNGIAHSKTIEPSLREGSITPKQDADYFAAVERGDTETAQKMVDEAAKAAGYTLMAGHATGHNFTEFKREAISDSDPDTNIRGFHFSTEPSEFSAYQSGGQTVRKSRGERIPTRIIHAYLKPGEMVGRADAQRVVDKQIRSRPMDENLRDEDTFPAGKNTVEFVRPWTLTPEKRVEFDKTGELHEGSKVLVRAEDGVDYMNEADDYGGRDHIITYDNLDEAYQDHQEGHYIVKDPSQIKSVDPITRDANGRVIPLSERFNQESNDIRYSLGGTPESGEVKQSNVNRALDLLRKTPVGRKLLRSSNVVQDWQRVLSHADNKTREFTANEINTIKASQGFYDPVTGRSFVVRDNIILKPGETPEQAIVRVMMHERVGHDGMGFMRANDPEFEKLYHEVAGQIPKAELDAIAERYGYDPVHDRDRIIGEWFARNVESLKPGELPNPQSVFGRMWQAVKDFISRLTGKQSATDQGVRDLAAAIAHSDMALEPRLGKGDEVEPSLQKIVKDAYDWTKDKAIDARDMLKEGLKVQAFTPFRKTINRFGTTLQRASLEGRQFQREFKSAVKDPLTRRGIGAYIEAGGDQKLLAQWEQASSGAAKTKYQKSQNLTPEEVKWADNISDRFEKLGQDAVAAGVLDPASIKQGYLTKIWKQSLSPKKQQQFAQFANKLSQNFKFGNKSRFSNFFEGEQAGFSPHTDDPLELLPIYQMELSKTVGTRNMIKDLTTLKAQDGNPLAVPVGGSVDLKLTMADRLKKGSFEATHQPLVGADQRVKVLSDNGNGTFHVREVGTKNEFDVPESELKVSDPSMVTSRAPQVGDVNYRRLDNPALKKWKWVDSLPDGTDVLMNGELAVHPEIYQHMKNMLGRSAIKEWYDSPSTTLGQSVAKKAVKISDVLNSSVKQSMLSFSPFHIVQEATHAVGHKVNPFSMEKVDPSNPAHRDAMEHGLILSGDHTAMDQWMEGASGEGWASKIPGIGKINQAIGDFTFHDYIPGLKIKTYEAALARNMERFKSDIASGKHTESDIKALTAEQVNNAYGGLNYRDMGSNPTVEHVLRLALLAPDFLRARLGFTKQAVQGLASKTGREQTTAMAVLAGTIYTAARVINGIINNGDTKAKEAPFGVMVDGKVWTLRNVPEDIYKAVTEPRKFISGRLSPLIARTALEGLTGKDYRGQNISEGQVGLNALMQAIPISLREIPGLKDLTQTTAQSPISGLEQLMSAMGVHASRWSPVTNTYRNLNEWEKSQGKPDRGTLPVSKYAQLRYRLEDSDAEGAKKEWDKLIEKEHDQEPKIPVSQLKDKLAKGFHQSTMKGFAENADDEKEFYKSLDPDQKLQFKEATKMKSGIWRRFVLATGKGKDLSATPKDRLQ